MILLTFAKSVNNFKDSFKKWMNEGGKPDAHLDDINQKIRDMMKRERNELGQDGYTQFQNVFWAESKKLEKDKNSTRKL